MHVCVCVGGGGGGNAKAGLPYNMHVLTSSFLLPLNSCADLFTSKISVIKILCLARMVVNFASELITMMTTCVPSAWQTWLISSLAIPL